MNPLCEAGRRYGCGGRWRVPCPHPAVHAIANPIMPPILLCDAHFQEIADRVPEPNIGREEFDRREFDRRQRAELAAEREANSPPNPS